MPSLSPLLCLGVNVACSLYMTGLIFFVQFVHYPLFELVGQQQFRAYAAAHTRRTGWVTAPVMCLELFASAWLAFHPPDGLPLHLLWAAASFTVLLWTSTFFLQIPAHNQLAKGFSPAPWRKLLQTNWLRTTLWSLRSALLIFLMERLWQNTAS